MTLKKALIAAVIIIAYIASVGFAYYRGRIDHEVSAEAFVEIAKRYNSSGISHVIGHDSERAYLVYHTGLFAPGEYVYSTKLAALPADVRAQIAAGVVLR